MQLLESIKNSVEILNNTDEYINTLNDKLSEYDLRTTDLLHIIENEKINSSQCWRILKELKNVRNERRKVKNNMAIAHVFEKHRNKLINKDNRLMLMAELFKAEKSLGIKYNYKMYSDEEINEFLR